jgi:hypothetical protein
MKTGIIVVSDRKYSENSVPIVSILFGCFNQSTGYTHESLCETGAAEGNTESEGVFCPIILIESVIITCE